MHNAEGHEFLIFEYDLFICYGTPNIYVILRPFVVTIISYPNATSTRSVLKKHSLIPVLTLIYPNSSYALVEFTIIL